MKFIIHAALMLCAVLGYSQLNTQWSPLYKNKVPKTTVNSSFSTFADNTSKYGSDAIDFKVRDIWCNDVAIYLIREVNKTSAKRIKVETFHNITLEKVKEVEVEFNREDVDGYKNIYFINNKLYLTGTLFSKKEGFYKFKWSVINANGTTSSWETVAENAVEKMLNPGEFLLYQSPNYSKQLLVQKPPFVRGENETIIIKVLNEKLETVWETTFKLPFATIKNRQAFDWRINNQGDVYFVRNDYANKTLELFSFEKQNNEFTREVISVEETVLVDPVIQFNYNNELTIGGLYSKKKLKNTIGTFVMVKSKNSNLVKHLVPYGKTFLSNFYNEKFASKPDMYIEFYKTKHVLIDAENNVLVFGEYVNDRKAETIESTPHNIIKTHIRTENVFVFKLNQRGNVLWHQIVPKKQSGTHQRSSMASTKADIPYDSFLPFLDANNTLNMLYNNFELRPNNSAWREADGAQFKKTQFSNANAYPVFNAKINADGNWLTQNLKYGEPQFRFFPEGLSSVVNLDPDFYRINKNRLLILGTIPGNDNYTLGIINFDQ